MCGLGTQVNPLKKTSLDVETHIYSHMITYIAYRGGSNIFRDSDVFENPMNL